MPANRRVYWLAGALLATIGIALWSWWGGSEPAAAAVARRARPAAADRAPADTSGPVNVRLEALETERNGPDGRDRNPFRFGSQSRASGDGGPAAPAATPAFTPVVPTGPPPPAPIALKYIGVVEKSDGTKVAILSGSGYTLSGREGESVDGRYRILKIGVESLEIARLDGQGRQTIRLTGQ